MKIAFSGHETFVCRSFWLKKGYDFITHDNRFGDPDAVVKLGVGKNMVTAINFWMRGFDIHEKDDKEPTEFGKTLLGKLDPFLEDAASLWLLHYSIVRNQKVYIFNSFFNEFTKERSEFTKEHLISYLKRKTEEAEIRLFSDKTYESDVSVFLRTYVKSSDGRADLEDEAANLLIDLNLLTTYQKENADGKLVQWYRTSRLNRNDLPLQVLLYAILDRFGDTQQSVSFSDLLEASDSPGIIFRLSESALEEKLVDLAAVYFNDLTYSDTAGNRVLQFRNTLDKWKILGEYYD